MFLQSSYFKPDSELINMFIIIISYSKFEFEYIIKKEM